MDVAIDYTKKPPAPAAGGPGGVSLSKVTLTKAAPTVSLTKRDGGGGQLRVNLNWNSRPQGGNRLVPQGGNRLVPQSGGGLFRKREPDLDLDLGCLYEFTDGTKGVVQALGNAFQAVPRGAAGPAVWLDGDDRSGSNAAGENLFVDLAQAGSIRRVLVFAYIYQGAAHWAGASGLVTLSPPAGPEVEVHLDEPRDGARTCAIALLTPSAGSLSVQREIRYVDGTQAELDRAYDWGIRWGTGRK